MAAAQPTKNFPLNYNGKIDFEGSFQLEKDLFWVRGFKAEDAETLRIWKNKNRKYFLFQKEISPEQQKFWFEEFVKNPAQQIFVCTLNEKLVACVGFRTKDGKSAELFNLINGSDEYMGKGMVSGFFRLCLGKLKNLGFNRVFLKVLRSNENGMSVYKHWGFSIFGEDNDCLHLEMKL
jgi:N-acetylglutamate synthase-like GNAT family acetyltransferase